MLGTYGTFNRDSLKKNENSTLNRDSTFIYKIKKTTNVRYENFCLHYEFTIASGISEPFNSIFIFDQPFIINKTTFV